MWKQLWVGVLAVSLTACAIHPLPEDVTGVPTNLIVRKIRCEARAAIKDNLLQFLEISTPDDRKIAEGIRNGTIPFEKVNDAMFSGYSKSIVPKFENSGIAYDFIFDTTETNNVDPTLDLTDIFSNHGKLTSSVAGNYDRIRQSTRNFTITDTFIKLIALEGKKPNIYCPEIIQEANYAYPITGTVGLDESLHQFVTMTLFDNLSSKDTGPATMVDKLIFTTKLSLNTSPKVTLTPVGMGVHFLDFLLGVTASRNDVHTLNVAFALPKPAPPPAPASTALAPPVHALAEVAAPLVLPTQLPREVSATGVRSGLFVNATGTPAELLAAQALDQAILRFEIGKAGAIIIPTP